MNQSPNNNGHPNIIFILGDNQNAGIMGCSGHLFIKTPNLDRLADEGVRMGNTFSTTPLCSPSQASLLNGFYSHNHGVLNNQSQWNESTPTFLEILSDVGNSTAFIGKWHMPGKGLPKLPFLDLFVSYTYREGQGSYFNCPMIVNGEEIRSRKAYITGEITDYAIEFIQNHCKAKEKKNRPFPFLFRIDQVIRLFSRQRTY